MLNLLERLCIGDWGSLLGKLRRFGGDVNFSLAFSIPGGWIPPGMESKRGYPLFPLRLPIGELPDGDDMEGCSDYQRTRHEITCKVPSGRLLIRSL